MKKHYPKHHHLGIKIVQHLNWQYTNNIAVKLNTVNAMLYKVRQFIHERTLISIYQTVFDSYYHSGSSKKFNQ